jgi:hypothetical protein
MHLLGFVGTYFGGFWAHHPMQGASWQWLTEVTRDVESLHNGTLEHMGHHGTM